MVANNLSQSLTLLTNVGGRQFVKSSIAVGDLPAGVAMCDWDNDGITDCVVALRASGRVVLLRGLGNGQFALAWDVLSGGGRPKDIASGDFDGDGFKDAIVLNEFGNNVCVITNNQAGGVGVVTCDAVTGGNLSLRVADLDRNGLLDAIVASPSTDTVSVFLNANEPATTGASLDEAGESGSRARIAIYPNPAKGNAWVSSTAKSGKISVVDLQGRTVASWEASPGMKKLVGSDGRALKAGVYLLKTSGSPQSASARLVIVK